MSELTTPETVTRLRSKDLLGIAELTPEEILLILDTAEAMKEIATRPIKKVPTLRGKTVINLFFEPTHADPHLVRARREAPQRRHAQHRASSTSSVVKGETLLDTARNLEAMAPDIIVMRHALLGAPPLPLRASARRASSTRATACTSTRRRRCSMPSRSAERKGRLAGLKVAIVGDIAAQPRRPIEHAPARQARRRGLGRRSADADSRGASRATRRAGRPRSLDAAIEGADVVMMLRIQLERLHGGFFPSPARVLQRCSA